MPRTAAVRNGSATDITIISTEPVELMFANDLGAYGVNVRVVEQREKLIDYPCAIGIDDEALRSFQAIRLIDEVQPHTTPHHWMRFTDGNGECFASIEPKSDEFGVVPPKRLYPAAGG